MSEHQMSAVPASLSPQESLVVVLLKRVGPFAVPALLLVPGVWFAAEALSPEGRVALIVFGLAVLAWCLTSADSTYVAVAAALAPVLIGTENPSAFFDLLGQSMLWLLLGAFVVAAACAKSGLAARLTAAVMRGRTTTLGLTLKLVGAIMVSAFIVPATSGRAALFLPVYSALSGHIKDKKVLRALALIIPVAILLSAAASLIGAGAHLVLVEVLAGLGYPRIDYVQWLLWGAPFALVSCLLSLIVILWLFLDRDQRRQALSFEGATSVRSALTREERFVLLVVAAMVVLWITAPLHGLSAAVVAVGGALMLTAPGIGALSFKEGVKSANWSLLLFMAATIKLGSSLMESGAARWLMDSIFTAVSQNPGAVLATVIVVSLLAHLVITSRSARASILVPMVIVLAVPAGLDPMALAFVSTIAAGYCLSLPLSAKPLAMFAQLDGVSFTTPDLLKLGLWLIPLHLVLLGLFATVIWPLQGLELFTTEVNALPWAPAQSTVE